ncbi:MAG TPA: enoyl-CoA hydratase-related protein [Acidimicrobiales bacterium]|jgi:enoyl-CoA hydratase|nr:enoyl-CoA hydratase-related protein [Acidimicrobiales bacterium]
MAGGESTGGDADRDRVRLEYRGDVALLTLDHPEDRNALSLAMTSALVDAVTQVQADGVAAALVVTANGPVFSSGGSVDDLLEPKAPLEEMYAGFVAIAHSGLPTVAAVNGPALGAGMNLALACDLIICSPAARFETRFLGVGLHPGGGHLWLLRERIGRQGAVAMAVFGAALDGEEAAARGLAWRCVDEDQLLGVALELAAGAASLDRALVARTLATLDDQAAVHRMSDALALELPPQQWSMGRPEFASRLELLRVRLGRHPG